MSRQARIKDDYGIFYITQKSGDSRHVFECDIDRERFLTILATAQTKFHFKLYAYCILSSDEYYLVMDVNGGDLSKIMKSINIAYAMYTKCQGKLFKDRYKSKLLSSDEEIFEVVNQIKKQFQVDLLWNSYCTFNGLTPLNINLISSTQTDETYFNKTCIHCIGSLTEAKEKLQEIAFKENQTISRLINSKDRRNQLIKDFRKYSTLSLKDLGFLFGGLSESSICKILNQ